MHPQATNFEPLCDQLRSPAAAGLSSDEKLSLWRGLACHSFCRASGFCPNEPSLTHARKRVCVCLSAPLSLHATNYEPLRKQTCMQYF
jgi:hypothetical protein